LALPEPLQKLKETELGFIANPICPFCQRVQILLNDAKLPHTRVDLDFTDKPDWLTGISPFGKVPVLIHGSVGIFSSGAIIEHLNHLAGGGYSPTDFKQAALMRSWCQSADLIHDEVRKYFTALEPAPFEAAHAQVVSMLETLARECPPEFLQARPLSLLTVCLAPLFVLLSALEVHPRPFLAEQSSLGRLRANLFELEAVAKVNTAEFRARLLRFVAARPSVFSRHDEVQAQLRIFPEFNGEKNAHQYLAQR